MLSKLAQWWQGKSSPSNPASWFSEWATGGNKSAAGISISQSRALEEVITMACVSIRSQDLAKLPLHVYKRRSDGGAEVVKDHPIERLLRKPNRWQTRFEFMEQMHAAFLLKGTLTRSSHVTSAAGRSSFCRSIRTAFACTSPRTARCFTA